MARKSTKQPKARVVQITPAMATKLLADSRGRNGKTPIRKINKGRVERYAADMKADNFTISESAIVLNHLGKLINGHHRCSACVIAQVPFRSLLLDFTGSPKDLVDDCLRQMDQGAARTCGDKLEMEGIVAPKESRHVASAANFIWRHDNYSLAERSVHPSHQAVFDTVHEEGPGQLVQSVECARNAKHVYPRVAELAALHRLFSRNDDELATLFVDSLATGENLKQSDAVYLLRERLIKDRAARQGRKMSPHERMAITIKAWNYTRVGGPSNGLRRLTWRSRGKRPEPFPAIK